MSVSLYISGAKIQVVEGSKSPKKPSVHRVMTIDMPPHVMDNGAVTDEKTFVKTMRDFWIQEDLPTKDVNLLLYNKLVTNGMVDVPAANEKKTYEFVKRELAVYEDDVESIYAYQIIKKADKNAQRDAQKAQKKEAKKNAKKKKNKQENEFLASLDLEEEGEKTEETIQAVPNSLDRMLAARIDIIELKRCITLLHFAGIQLSGIYSGIINLVHAIGSLKEVANTTCIVQLHDDQYLINLLFLDGVYHYSSATKIFEQEGTIGFAIEVARSASGILQFMKANSIEYDTMKVLLTGFDPEDTINCTDSILQMNSALIVEDIESEWLVDNDTAENISEYIIAFSGLSQVKKTADFYPAYQQYIKKEKKGGGVLKAMVPIFALTGIFLTVTIVLGAMNVSTDLALNSANKYNESVMDMAMQYDLTLDDAIYYEGQYSAVEQIKENINSYPCADSKIEKIVRTIAAGYVEVEVQSYDASSGLYNISASAENVEKINQYIDRMRQSDVFVKIDYTGYNFDESANKWQINVLCYLAESAGKDAK